MHMHRESICIRFTCKIGSVDVGRYTNIIPGSFKFGWIPRVPVINGTTGLRLTLPYLAYADGSQRRGQDLQACIRLVSNESRPTGGDAED